MPAGVPALSAGGQEAAAGVLPASSAEDAGAEVLLAPAGTAPAGTAPGCTAPACTAPASGDFGVGAASMAEAPESARSSGAMDAPSCSASRPSAYAKARDMRVSTPTEVCRPLSSCSTNAGNAATALRNRPSCPACATGSCRSGDSTDFRWTSRIRRWSGHRPSGRCLSGQKGTAAGPA